MGIAVGMAVLALGLVGMVTSLAGSAGVGLVCFWSAQGPVCVERTIPTGPRMRDQGKQARALLKALLAGPTAGETRQGIWSAIPPGTALDAPREVTEMQSNGIVVVRLKAPPGAWRELDHETFEIIVRQIGGTLEPLEWRELYIQTWDPIAGEFVPLADLLPPIPAPRKETLLSDEERGEEISAPLATAGGQPPAPGQGQPRGALSGKTVYVSAGHGWQWNDYVNDWRTQRPPYPNPPYVGPIIEDHNNAEAVNQYLLHYLWNAGAQVWPVRERDMSGAEVVVDNDDPGPGAGYTESGLWTTAAVTGTGYAGTDYRFATTVTGTPTAAAVWTATLPTDGRYAVYVWYRPGYGRAPDARYTIHHAGGETVVSVNQQHHGLTWHYVGSYGFRGGRVACVTLTNQSAVTGAVVVADAVRFGGGTFNDLEHIQTDATYPPDKPWWEIAAFYYTQRMGMGKPPGDVTARPLYARWEHAGTGDDAVYVSWHTNGVSGYQTHTHGTVSIIHNGEGNPITPGSELLRDTIHEELVHDVRVGWDANWPGYKRSMNLGELRELWDDYPAYSLPGTLIEVAYHDHPADTDALKEPLFNMLAARAFYQGIVKYFEQRDGVDLTLLPEPPTHLAVRNVSGGQVRVSWRPSPTDTIGLVGDPATGYRVYTSTDGLGWSDGVPVKGSPVYTITALAPGQLLFVHVTATNDGGESFPTETQAVRGGNGEAEILLVSGFDRLNRTLAVPDYDPVEGYNVRLFLERMNRYDYTVQHGEVIPYPFDGASNEAVRDGLVNLADYALVDWTLGEESAPDETLDATERALLETFLSAGGALFISGTEIGWHLDGLGTAPNFYNGVLRATYAGDDAETYQVAPAPGSIFEGLDPFRFDAPGTYDADYPDLVLPIGGSTAALDYVGGVTGTAAVQYADGCERLVYFGFPFETIWPNDRPRVMERVLDFLGLCLTLPLDTHISTPADGSAYNYTPSFAGTAEAGRMAALDRIEVQIFRAADGRYWAGDDWMTGTAWITGTVWVTGTAWVPATGTHTWFYVLPALSDSAYRLRARAWTEDGDADPTPAEVAFIYDTHPPAGTVLITPTGGVTVSASSGVTLVWEAVAPDGGSALAYLVQLDGTFYTTTHTTHSIPSIAAGLHTWGVQVFDAAGNRSAWITDTFYVHGYPLWLPLVMRGFDEGGMCADVIVNGGFETDTGWMLNQLAVYDSTNPHSGERSARVGIMPGEAGSDCYSSVRQEVTLPPGSAATLRLWVYPIGEGNDPGDGHYVGLRDQSGVYRALDSWQSDARIWEQRRYDVSDFVEQTVTLYVGTRNDGDDDTAALYVDDVVLEVCP